MGKGGSVLLRAIHNAVGVSGAQGSTHSTARMQLSARLLNPLCSNASILQLRRALTAYLRQPAALRTPGLFVNRADHMVPGTDSKIVR